MAPNFYATREDVQVVAICFRDQYPQIQGTVKAGGKCQAVFGSGGRAVIKDGDYILFGSDGKPASVMPGEMFGEMFVQVEAPAEAPGLVIDGPMMGESPVNAPSAEAPEPEPAPEPEAPAEDPAPEPPTTEPIDTGSIFGDVDAPADNE